jgi:hypothetical protein
MSGSATLIVLVLGASSIVFLAVSLLMGNSAKSNKSVLTSRDRSDAYIDRWAAKRTQVPPVRVSVIGLALAAAGAVVLLVSGNWTV